MAVRSTMSDLIALVRTLVADLQLSNPQFQDQQIQDRLDASRDDIRYESLAIAPSIVNINNQAQTIYADYYSDYQWWEADVVIQGMGSTGAPWIVLTPTSSDLITGHWMFEATPFTNGTVPGQLPPLFATGKIYDPNCAAADLLEFWAATLAGSYDISVDGQSLHRSQLMQAKLTLAQYYRSHAKAKSVKMLRRDVMPTLSTMKTRLLDSQDIVKGGR